MNTTPRGVVSYSRRSSDRDDLQTLSIEAQLDELRKLAATRGINLAEEFTESSSAREPGRPVFNEVMKQVRAGKIKGVLVWRLDRLARNMVDGGAIIYELSEGRLQEIVTPDETYTNTGDAKFVLAMQFGMAAKFTDDLSDNIKRGNRKVLEHGRVPGRVPLGYLKTQEHRNGRGAGSAYPDPERFDLVRRLWKEVLLGEESVSAVWRKARFDWGLTTVPTANELSRPISLTYVYHMLRNPFYAGVVVRDGVTYKAEHAPMVTVEEFERVQTVLGKHVPSPPAPHAIEFLYRGVLRCGHCSRHLVGERHEKQGHVYVYYRCGRRTQRYYRCPAPAVREAEVTEAVELGRLGQA
jgi:site-specific DNA recombinase